MTGAPVLYEKADGGIAWVTLNRPDVLNAINMRMRDEMWEIMHAVRDDPDVRAVIFRGAGDRAFSPRALTSRSSGQRRPTSRPAAPAGSATSGS